MQGRHAVTAVSQIIMKKSRPPGKKSPSTRLCCKSETRTIHIGSETADLARQCLEAYVHGFQARNHTLRMFSAHLHMDEATPHVHIDFVPYITGSKRGMDTRVSLKQALAQMGFVGGTRSATEWNLWVQREKQVLADIMQEHGIEWEQLGTHEEHLSVLEYKKQERSKEVKELDSAIAQKRTEVEKIEDTLQAVQKQVVDLDKIEAVSAKKALLSDRVTLPRNDFENLLHAAKQYVVYRRQDEQLQKLLDAAQEKIRQLESVLNSLKEKVNDLTNRLAEQTSHHRQALMVERAQRMQMKKENARLKREKAGMVSLLRKHKIEWKENLFTERNER